MTWLPRYNVFLFFSMEVLKMKSDFSTKIFQKYFDASSRYFRVSALSQLVDL